VTHTRGDRAGFPAETPDAFAVPWTVALGAAAFLGPNGDRANEPPPVALAAHPEWGEGPAWEPQGRAPVLLSVQVDLIGPASGATSAAAAFDASPRPSGRSPSLVARLGAEWEPWPSTVRLRAGTYLEPSRVGASTRLHGTFGVEGRVPFWLRDLDVGVGGDVADRYRTVSFSLGFWGDVGPAPPRPPALVAPVPP